MRWFFTILILVAGLFAVVLALGHAISVREAQQLMAGGAQAEGTITEQLGARRSNARFYSYRFSVAGREWTATRRDIPWGARELPVGSKVPVRYDPAKPERSVTPAELEALEGWGNRSFFPLVAAGLIGWGIARIVRRRKPAT